MGTPTISLRTKNALQLNMEIIGVEGKPDGTHLHGFLVSRMTSGATTAPQIMLLTGPTAWGLVA